MGKVIKKARTRSLLNKPELKIYELISQELKDTEYKIFPQVPIACYTNAYVRTERFCRPDFTIFDKAYKPVCAIEYNGTGHFKKNDETKRKLLSEYGVKYHTISHKEVGENKTLKVEALRHRIDAILATFLETRKISTESKGWTLDDYVYPQQREVKTYKQESSLWAFLKKLFS